MTGGWGSPTVIDWLHVATFEQQSIACHVRVYTRKQALEGDTIVLSTVIVTFVPQHASKAVGVSNVQPVPHSSVRGPLQLITGGFVSIIVTTCVQNEEFE